MPVADPSVGIPSSLVILHSSFPAGGVMSLFDKFSKALPYTEFMARYGHAAYAAKWKATFDQVTLTPAQRELLGKFKRETPVLVLAGAWCGDCSSQCPIFDRFAEAAPVIKVRYLAKPDPPAPTADRPVNAGKG